MQCDQVRQFKAGNKHRNTSLFLAISNNHRESPSLYSQIDLRLATPKLSFSTLDSLRVRLIIF